MAVYKPVGLTHFEKPFKKYCKFILRPKMDEENRGPLIRFTRPVLTQDQYERDYVDRSEDDQLRNQSCPKRFCYSSKKMARKCLPKSVASFFFRLFPFIQIMRNYSWKKDLIRDLTAGATVAFLHVPQAMAYGQLASLRPIHGLYVAFFPSIFYFFFGTSRHMSVGVFAVMSLMVAKVLDNEISSGAYGLPPKPSADGNNTGNLTLEEYLEMEMDVRIEIATGVNIIVGLIQVVLGILGVGFISNYLTQPFISGYTTASACHVLISQIFQAVGIKGKRYNGAFKLLFVIHFFCTFLKIDKLCLFLWQILRDFFTNLGKIHWITLGVFLGTCLLLILWKELGAERLKKYCSIPVPIELIVVMPNVFF